MHHTVQNTNVSRGRPHNGFQPRSHGPGEDPGNEVADCYFIVNVLDLAFAQTVHSPLFFREIVQIYRVLPSNVLKGGRRGL